jgi:hypothetical protein
MNQLNPSSDNVFSKLCGISTCFLTVDFEPHIYLAICFRFGKQCDCSNRTTVGGDLCKFNLVFELWVLNSSDCKFFAVQATYPALLIFDSVVKIGLSHESIEKKHSFPLQMVQHYDS